MAFETLSGGGTAFLSITADWTCTGSPDGLPHLYEYRNYKIPLAELTVDQGAVQHFNIPEGYGPDSAGEERQGDVRRVQGWVRLGQSRTAADTGQLIVFLEIQVS